MELIGKGKEMIKKIENLLFILMLLSIPVMVVYVFLKGYPF